MQGARKRRKANLERVRRHRRTSDPSYWRYGRETGALPTPVKVCINCGQPGSHFVPPSLGEDGFFSCSALNEAKFTSEVTKVMHDDVEVPGVESVTLEVQSVVMGSSTKFVAPPSDEVAHFDDAARRHLLQSMGVTLLRKEGAKHKVKGCWDMKKADLIEAILEAPTVAS